MKRPHKVHHRWNMVQRIRTTGCAHAATSEAERWSKCGSARDCCCTVLLIFLGSVWSAPKFSCAGKPRLSAGITDGKCLLDFPLRRDCTGKDYFFLYVTQLFKLYQGLKFALLLRYGEFEWRVGRAVHYDEILDDTWTNLLHTVSLYIYSLTKFWSCWPSSSPKTISIHLHTHTHTRRHTYPPERFQLSIQIIQTGEHVAMCMPLIRCWYW